MQFKGIEIFCPVCRGDLERPDESTILCRHCARRFPVTLDIPDLRVREDPYITLEDEYAKVRKLAAAFPDCDFPGFLDFYYRNTPVVPPHHAARFKRGLLAGQARAHAWLATWEEESAAARKSDCNHESFLDLGCGTGPLLVAAGSYATRVGVDIALRWLVVGKKRLQAAGLDLPLICACAEALPLPSDTFSCAALDSSLEHFADQPQALAQVMRVLKPGGKLFLATPNRFSIGPDPQSGLPAGSMLPQSWTAAFMRRQGALPPQRHLVSAGQLRTLLEGAGFRDIKIFLPGIPKEQRALYSPLLRTGAAVYDAARRWPVSEQILRLVGPLLHAVAWRGP